MREDFKISFTLKDVASLREPFAYSTALRLMDAEKDRTNGGHIALVKKMQPSRRSIPFRTTTTITSSRKPHVPLPPIEKF